MTDFRAMCAELVDAYVRGNNLAESIFRARTLLDQPAAESPADGEVAELQRWGVDHGAQPGRPLLSPMEDGYWTPWHIAADLLQRQHPQPVAVSERLPGPEDCDVQGRCWLWERDCGYSGCKWALVDRTWSLSQTDEDLSVYTHWLPANALPLPTPEAL